jgi:hypothetical protein
VALILTQVNERDVQQDVVDDAIAARDQNFDLLHDIVTRAPQLIDSVLDDADPLNNDLDDVFNVDPDSQHGVMERARRLVSLWTRVNVKRAAMTPPKRLWHGIRLLRQVDLDDRPRAQSVPPRLIS